MNAPRLKQAKGANELICGRYNVLRSTSFVGLLLDTSICSVVGLPIAEYFIWYDDVEYSKRLARKFLGVYIPESTLIHATPSNVPVDFEHIGFDNAWKYSYGWRNSIAGELAHRNYLHAAKNLVRPWLEMVRSGKSVRLQLRAANRLQEVPKIARLTRRSM